MGKEFFLLITLFAFTIVFVWTGLNFTGSKYFLSELALSTDVPYVSKKIASTCSEKFC